MVRRRSQSPARRLVGHACAAAAYLLPQLLPPPLPHSLRRNTTGGVTQRLPRLYEPLSYALYLLPKIAASIAQKASAKRIDRTKSVILIQLYGRSPCTSPVRPLMIT